MQGFSWDTLNYSRDMLRNIRVQEYKNFRSVEHSISDLEQVDYFV